MRSPGSHGRGVRDGQEKAPGRTRIAEAKPAADVNFDRLNFAVRGLVDFDHMTEFLAVAADNGPIPQGCKPLVRVTQSVDHSLTGLRKRGALFHCTLANLVRITAFFLDVNERLRLCSSGRGSKTWANPRAMENCHRPVLVTIGAPSNRSAIITGRADHQEPYKWSSTTTAMFRVPADPHQDIQIELCRRINV
jgi:hypothetical protein